MDLFNNGILKLKYNLNYLNKVNKIELYIYLLK